MDEDHYSEKNMVCLGEYTIWIYSTKNTIRANKYENNYNIHSTIINTIM